MCVLFVTIVWDDPVGCELVRSLLIELVIVVGIFSWFQCSFCYISLFIKVHQRGIDHGRISGDVLLQFES